MCSPGESQFSCISLPISGVIGRCYQAQLCNSGFFFSFSMSLAVKRNEISLLYYIIFPDYIQKLYLQPGTLMWSSVMGNITTYLLFPLTDCKCIPPPPQLKCQEREWEGGKSSTFYSLKLFHSFECHPFSGNIYLLIECKAVLGVLFLTLNLPHYEYFAHIPSAIL